MGLFGKGTALTPPGVGSGMSQDQLAMFANAAQSSGLADIGMGVVDQWTGGGVNTEEIELMYHLMARHPNEVDLFLAENVNFLVGLAELIAIIVRKELYTWWNSGASAGSVNAEKAAELGYSTITQENIDAILSKMTKGIDAQGMETTPQQRINVSDSEAIALINQHKYGVQLGAMQNQQLNWQQQQMYNQQQMYQQPQQQPGISGALGNFSSTLIRGALGLPPTPMYAQQYGQPNMGYQQPMNGQTS